MDEHTTNPIDRQPDELNNITNGDKNTITSSCQNQRKAFENAAESIVSGSGACAGDSTSFGSEIRNLESWARSQAILIPEDKFELLHLVSNTTSEHQVFFKESESRAVKRTIAGFYGQIPIPENGNLGRRNALPSEYLKRMALQLAVFGGDIRLEGVTVSDKPSPILFEPPKQPSLVISQLWYERSGLASHEAIHDFLVLEGFRSVPSSYFGWYRAADRVVIVDAKPDNFVQTVAGLIPIDLQMAQFSEAELLEAGLSSDEEAPVIFIPRS
ncbi:MAG: hypothetical protein ACPG32_07180 [Akkermansiaceae bacterium]